MIPNADSLRDKLKSLSKQTGINTQILSKKYFIDNFLETLSQSKYRHHFIWKGGFVLSALSGIEKRTTIDIDVLIQGIKVDEGQIAAIINQITSSGTLKNALTFEISKIKPIMNEKDYTGYRVFMLGKLGHVKEAFHLDIAVGERLVPSKISFSSQPMLNKHHSFEIYIYRPERMLAEKIQTILARSTASSRFKDFFDVYLFSQLDIIDKEILQTAFQAVMQDRSSQTLEEDWREIVMELEQSERMKNGWKLYQKKNAYVGTVTYELTMEHIKKWLKSLTE
ncbi:MAG: nucleotidyl transferase AbiEii/AbiGii toxin family protein [Turicibacter sp.]|nr:nucleotidyl transferase AbiEii/AbiGii toxin family protein [Turicibacter sp.]